MVQRSLLLIIVTNVVSHKNCYFITIANAFAYPKYRKLNSSH